MGLRPRVWGRGFTLVELMIVCSVILVLAMVAIPNYRDYRNRAKQSSCVTLLRQMRDVKSLYYLTHNRVVPFPDGTYGWGPGRVLEERPRCPASNRNLNYQVWDPAANPTCDNYGSHAAYPHRLTGLYTY